MEKVNYNSLLLPISIMYLLVIMYSYICFIITELNPTHYFIFYHLVLFLFWFWHYLCHNIYTGEMYKIHMIHHLVDYPPNKFFGDNKQMSLLEIINPKNTTTFSLYHDGPLYILVIALLLIYKYMNFSYIDIIFMFTLAIIMGFVGTSLHRCFHVKGVFLEKYNWFNELRIYHYNHHLGNMKHNYGVFNIILEKILLGK